MNILREIRKLKQRSFAVRILILLVFFSIFIINTFAWYNVSRKVEISGFGATANNLKWNTEFYKNNELLDEVVIFNVDKIYPGIKFEDHVAVRNGEEKASRLYFSLKKIILFGDIIYLSNRQVNHVNTIEGQTYGDIVYSKSKYLQLEIKDDYDRVIETIDLQGYTNTLSEPETTTTIVNNKGEEVAVGVETGINRVEEKIIEADTVYATDTRYPFTITYGFNKDYIEGRYGTDETTPGAFADFYLKLDWDYEIEDVLATANNEGIDRDDLDTWYGKKAYAFYNMTEAEVEQKVKNFYLGLLRASGLLGETQETFANARYERAKNEKINALKSEIMEMINNERAMTIEVEVFASS